MRAVLISTPGDADVLKLGEIPEPVLGPAQLRVRVKAVGINRADILQRRGLYPAPPGYRADVPGLEYAGKVMEVGARVQGWSVGDRVMGLIAGGAYAEQVVVHAREALRVPEGLSWAEAAAIPEAFLTAYDAMQLQGGLRMGESVLIHAVASGVGTAAVQLARAAGARSFGTSRTAAKLAPCVKLGLDVPICTKEADFAEVVSEAGGADVVLDLVGGGYLEGNLKAAKRRGRIIVVGLLSGASAQIDLRQVLRKRLQITGTVLRARPVEQKIALAQDVNARMIPLFERGALKPVLDRTFPFAKAADAHRAMEANSNLGKIVLTW